jgi:hypothetical protein
MFAAVLLVGSGTGFWFISNNNEQEITTVSTDKMGASMQHDKQKAENPASQEDDLNKEERTNDFVEQGNTKKTVELDITNAAVKNQYQVRGKASEGFVKNPQESPVINEEKTRVNKTVDPVAKPELEKTENTATVPEQELKENRILTEEKVVEKTEQQTATPPVENNVRNVKEVADQNKKALLIGAMFQAGISNNGGSIPLFPQPRSADYLQFSNSPSQAPFNYMPAYDFSTSFSLGAGLFVQRQLSKKTAISIGLNYQRMAANITVGSRVDSIKAFQDSMLQKTATVTSFYRFGNLNKYRSKYHLLQIPVSMQFQLNRNMNKPLILSAGFIGGVLAGSNALYLNQNAKAYYKETDQFKRFTFSAQTGVSFTLLNHAKYQIQAGPHLQYQLSNLTKPVVHTNEHLWLLGVKGNILFKKSK